MCTQSDKPRRVSNDYDVSKKFFNTKQKQSKTYPE